MPLTMIVINPYCHYFFVHGTTKSFTGLITEKHMKEGNSKEPLFELQSPYSHKAKISHFAVLIFMYELTSTMFRAY